MKSPGCDNAHVRRRKFFFFGIVPKKGRDYILHIQKEGSAECA